MESNKKKKQKQNDVRINMEGVETDERETQLLKRRYDSCKALGQPLEEIDTFCYDDTFVAIVKKFGRNMVFRFECKKTLFLFGPCNFFRRWAVFMSTHPMFDIIVICTILANCFTLALSKTTVRFEPRQRRHFATNHERPWIQHAERVYLIIYVLEMLLKVIAKGFAFQKHAYLRNRWNRVDFLVVVISFTLETLEIIRESTGFHVKVDLEFLRLFRVLRAIKVISYIPGLRMIINAMSNAVIPLLEVMFLTLVCICCFALTALQVYMGKLQQICVVRKGSYQSRIFHLDPDQQPIRPTDPRADFLFAKWVRNQRNWLTRDEPNLEYRPCGNDSGSRPCPKDYTCMQVTGGPNPDNGWTGFDNIFAAFLSTFQLVTLDYWERLYELVLSTVGSWGMIFFILVVFLGSFYLMNLLLAVVARCYEDEVQKVEEGPFSISQKMAMHRTDSSFSIDCILLVELEPMLHHKPRTRADKEAMARAKVRAHLDGQTEEEKEHRMAATGNLAHAIWSVLGRNVSGKVALPHPVTNHIDEMDFSDEDEADASPPPSMDKSFSFTVTKSDLEEAELATEPPRTSSMQNSGTDTETEISTLAATMKSSAMSVLSRESDLRDSTPSSASTFSFHGETRKCRCCWCCKNEDDDDFDFDSHVDHEKCSYFKGCFLPNIQTNEVRYVKHWSCLTRVIIDKTVEICTIIAEDESFDIVVTILIMINTVLMSSEHYGMPIWHALLLEITGHFFTAAFTLEFLIKFVVLRVRYFEDKWNVFDFMVVVVTYADFLIDEFYDNNFASFRAIRLLRIFKLGQNWVTMKILLGIIVTTFSSLWNLTILLGIIIYIFAIIGMQVFGGQYLPEYFSASSVTDEAYPRWNFTDFWHAFMLVFRVVCGEWIEPLWQCLATYNTQEENGWRCFFLFMPVLVIGNFIVLNLFLALLLSSFNSEELVAQAEKTSEKSGKIKSLEKAMNLMMLTFGGHLVTSQFGDNLKPSEPADKQPETKNVAFKKAAHKVTLLNRKKTAEEVIEKYEEKFREGPRSPVDYDAVPEDIYDFIKVPDIDTSNSDENDDDPNYESLPTDEEEEKKNKGKENENHDSEDSEESESLREDADEDAKPVLADCCPEFCRIKKETCTDERWRNARYVCLKIISHWTFEWIILVLILASSITLCFEDVYLEKKKKTKLVLFLLNNSFTVLFVLEMLLKWVGLGLKRYFTNFWTILDVIIVLISLMTLGFDLSQRSWAERTKKGAAFQSLKAFRTLRALRPLRAISRWQGMKVVVNALIYAIPAIFNVLLVCILFWLIFAIMGVQFFAGKFYKCVDENGELAPLGEVKDVFECCANPKYSWINVVPNFDNIGQAYLSLFQVATFEGWMEIMRAASDIGSTAGKQQQREQTYVSNAFFVTFIVFGAFFTLNLFVGVIIDNFNSLKRKYEGNILQFMLSPGQMKYYTAMNKLGQKRARSMTNRPMRGYFRAIFDLAISRRFELFMFAIIFLNIIVMGFDYLGNSQFNLDILAMLTTLCNLMYIFEAVVKLMAFRLTYFTVPWNLFDFVLCIFSIFDVCRLQLSSVLPFSPTILRVIRVFRITRVLRLIKAAKGIRKLIQALTVSLPALVNIGALLGLITFIYSIIGMALFKDAPVYLPLDDMFSFQTFPKSFMLLFRVMTAAGWNDVLATFMVGDTYCGEFKAVACGGRGEPLCETQGFAVVFLVSYVMVNYLIVINMYIAIILENFDEANRDEEIGIEEEDLEMFYSHWSRYDPQATQFLLFSKLSDFLATLEEPFCIPRPNIVAIVAFNLPIARGNKIHCLDVLYSLVRHVLGGVVETESEVFKKLQDQMEQKFRRQFPERKLLDIISSTRIWKIQHNAAIIIQRYWRSYYARTRKHWRGDLKYRKPKLQLSRGSVKSSGGFANAMSKVGNFFSMGGGRQRLSSVPDPNVRRASVNPNSTSKKSISASDTLLQPNTSAAPPPPQRERRRSLLQEEVDEINRETRKIRSTFVPQEEAANNSQKRRKSSVTDPTNRRGSMDAEQKPRKSSVADPTNRRGSIDTESKRVAGPILKQPGKSKSDVFPQQSKPKKVSIAPDVRK